MQEGERCCQTVQVSKKLRVSQKYKNDKTCVPTIVSTKHSQGSVCDLLLQEGQSGMRADPQVLAGWTSIVSEVRRPIPLSKEIQQLEKETEKQKVSWNELVRAHRITLLDVIYFYSILFLLYFFIPAKNAQV